MIEDILFFSAIFLPTVGIALFIIEYFFRVVQCDICTSLTPWKSSKKIVKNNSNTREIIYYCTRCVRMIKSVVPTNK